MSDEQPIVEEETPKEKKKTFPGEPYTFDLVEHPYPYLLGSRVKVECHPHEHLLYEGLHHLRKFLLSIDDYDLVRRVCRIEERDYEHKGIGELYHLPSVPQPHWLPCTDLGEKYQSFLSHIEQLMKHHIIGREGRSSLYSFRDEQYKHPYAVLLYALALLPLGNHARYIGHGFLDYTRKLEYNCPGLAFVHEAYFIADMFYRRFEEKEKQEEK